MALALKLSTASQEIPLGYAVDSTDGNTEETALTIANTDIKLWKNGATTLANKNSGGATHISNGIYYAVLDATDTNTLGPLVVFCHPTGALPMRVECCVYPANVYDSLIGGTDTLQADVTQFGGTNATSASGRPEVNVTHENGTALSTAGAKAYRGLVDSGTAQSATGTTLVLRAAAAFADDELIGATIVITGGTTGVGQARVITDYVSATDTATVDTWTTTPTGTITYEIYATAPASTSSPQSVNLTAAAVDAIWDEPTSGHSTAGSTGKALTDAGSAGDPWSTALPGAYGAGTAGKIVGDNLNATVSSRATQTSVDTIDTNVDSILVDTAEIGAAGAGLTALGDARLANLDATVSSRSTLTAAQVNAEVDSALDTAIPVTPTAGSVNALLQTNLDVPVSNVETDTQDLQTRLPAALVGGRMDSNVQAMAADVVDSGAMAATANNEIADALLNRNVAGGSSAGRLVKHALYRLINRVAIAAGVLTVYGTDDTTSAFTQTVTTTAGDPVSEVDTV